MKTNPAALASALALSTFSAAAQIPNPNVTGPIASTKVSGDPSHNYVFFSSNHELAVNGYVEEEYFIEGTANTYTTPTGATGTILTSNNPYKTRIVVRRPADKARFNGTVLVEWYNVTNGFDAENMWFFSWEHVMRSGYAWVGVSAQKVGVDRLKSCLRLQFTALMGGPATYPGKNDNGDMCLDMKTIHTGLQIPGTVFDKFVMDLGAVLKTDGVADDDITTIAGAVAGTKTDIVSPNPVDKTTCDAGTGG